MSFTGTKCQQYRWKWKVVETVSRLSYLTYTTSALPSTVQRRHSWSTSSLTSVHRVRSFQRMINFCSWVVIRHSVCRWVCTTLLNDLFCVVTATTHRRPLCCQRKKVLGWCFWCVTRVGHADDWRTTVCYRQWSRCSRKIQISVVGLRVPPM